MAKPPMIFLNPNEARTVQLGLARILEDTTVNANNLKIPWNPEARQAMKEIREAAGSAAKKIEKYTGIAATLPEYNEGDEYEFLTKES